MIDGLVAALGFFLSLISVGTARERAGLSQTTDAASSLEKIVAMRASGLLTDEEFSATKRLSLCRYKVVSRATELWLSAALLLA